MSMEGSIGVKITVDDNDFGRAISNADVLAQRLHNLQSGTTNVNVNLQPNDEKVKTKLADLASSEHKTTVKLHAELDQPSVNTATEKLHESVSKKIPLAKLATSLDDKSVKEVTSQLHKDLGHKVTEVHVKLDPASVESVKNKINSELNSEVATRKPSSSMAGLESVMRSLSSIQEAQNKILAGFESHIASVTNSAISAFSHATQMEEAFYAKLDSIAEKHLAKTKTTAAEIKKVKSEAIANTTGDIVKAVEQQTVNIKSNAVVDVKVNLPTSIPTLSPELQSLISREPLVKQVKIEVLGLTKVGPGGDFKGSVDTAFGLLDKKAKQISDNIKLGEMMVAAQAEENAKIEMQFKQHIEKMAKLRDEVSAEKEKNSAFGSLAYGIKKADYDRQINEMREMYDKAALVRISAETNALNKIAENVRKAFSSRNAMEQELQNQRLSQNQEALDKERSQLVAHLSQIAELKQQAAERLANLSKGYSFATPEIPLPKTPDPTGWSANKPGQTNVVAPAGISVSGMSASMTTALEAESAARKAKISEESAIRREQYALYIKWSEEQDVKKYDKLDKEITQAALRAKKINDEHYRDELQQIRYVEEWREQRKIAAYDAEHKRQTELANSYKTNMISQLNEFQRAAANQQQQTGENGLRRPTTPNISRGSVPDFGPITELTNVINKLQFALMNVGVVLSARVILDHVDQWIQFKNAVTISTEKVGNAVEMQKRIYDIAQDSRAPLEAVTSIFLRMSRASESLHMTQGETVKMIDTVVKSLAIMGTSPNQVRGGLLQLEQALGGVIVRGQEFKSVLDSMPVVMSSVVKHYDEAVKQIKLEEATLRGASQAELDAIKSKEGHIKTLADLRNAMYRGEVTSEQFALAIRLSQKEIDASFDKTQKTFAQAFNYMENEFTKFIGSMNDANSYSDTFYNIMVKLSSHMGEIVKGIVALGAGMFTFGIAAKTMALFDKEMEAGVIVIGTLTKATEGLTFATWALQRAMLAVKAVNWWAVLIAGIVAIGTYLYETKADITEWGDVWEATTTNITNDLLRVLNLKQDFIEFWEVVTGKRDWEDFGKVDYVTPEQMAKKRLGIKDEPKKDGGISEEEQKKATDAEKAAEVAKKAEETRNMQIGAANAAWDELLAKHEKDVMLSKEGSDFEKLKYEFLQKQWALMNTIDPEGQSRWAHEHGDLTKPQAEVAFMRDATNVQNAEAYAGKLAPEMEAARKAKQAEADAQRWKERAPNDLLVMDDTIAANKIKIEKFKKELEQTQIKIPLNVDIKGNNLGNIRPVSGEGFNKYNSPQEGLAAIDKQLAIYGSKHGVDTLEKAITRWSPPKNNKGEFENDTPRLIRDALKDTGLKPNQKIDLSDESIRKLLAHAIIRQEHGVKVADAAMKGFTTAPDSQLEIATKVNEIEKAGLEVEKAKAKFAADVNEENYKNYEDAQRNFALKTKELSAIKEISAEQARANKTELEEALKINAIRYKNEHQFDELKKRQDSLASARNLAENDGAQALAEIDKRIQATETELKLLREREAILAETEDSLKKNYEVTKDKTVFAEIEKIQQRRLELEGKISDKVKERTGLGNIESGIYNKAIQEAKTLNDRVEKRGFGTDTRAGAMLELQQYESDIKLKVIPALPKEEVEQALSNLQKDIASRTIEINAKFNKEELSNAMTEMDKLATNLNNTFGQMGEAVGAVGKALIENLAQIQANTDAAAKLNDTYANQTSAKDYDKKTSEEKLKIENDYHKQKRKLDLESAQLAIGGAANVAGAASRLFKEQSAGRKALHAVEVGLHSIEMAMSVAKIAMNVAEGASKFFAQSGWAGFAGVAAMLAVMAGLGVAVAGAGSGNKPADNTMPASSEKGTVLGSPEESSNSVGNIVKTLNDIHASEYAELKSMNSAFKTINTSMVMFTTQLVKQLQVTTPGTPFQGLSLNSSQIPVSKSPLYSNPASGIGTSAAIGAVTGSVTGGGLLGSAAGAMLGVNAGTVAGGVGFAAGASSTTMAQLIGGAIVGLAGGLLIGGLIWGLGKLLGIGKIKVTQLGEGILINQMKLMADDFDAQFNPQTFSKFEIKQKGWFGSKKTIKEVFAPVGTELRNALASVYVGFQEAVISSAGALGIGKILDYRMKDFEMSPLKIDWLKTKNEKGDVNQYVQDQINAHLDRTAMSIFGNLLGHFQKLGEGMLETVARLGVEVGVTIGSLRKLGINLGETFKDAPMAAIEFSSAMVELWDSTGTAKDGLKNLTAAIEGFYDVTTSSGAKVGNSYQRLSALLGQFTASHPGALDPSVNSSNIGTQGLNTMLQVTTKAAAQAALDVAKLSVLRDPVKTAENPSTAIGTTMTAALAAHGIPANNASYMTALGGAKALDNNFDNARWSTVPAAWATNFRNAQKLAETNSGWAAHPWTTVANTLDKLDKLAADATAQIAAAGKAGTSSAELEKSIAALSETQRNLAAEQANVLAIQKAYAEILKNRNEIANIELETLKSVTTVSRQNQTKLSKDLGKYDPATGTYLDSKYDTSRDIRNASEFNLQPETIANFDKVMASIRTKEGYDSAVGRIGKEQVDYLLNIPKIISNDLKKALAEADVAIANALTPAEKTAATNAKQGLLDSVPYGKETRQLEEANALKTSLLAVVPEAAESRQSALAALDKQLAEQEAAKMPMYRNLVTTPYGGQRYEYGSTKQDENSTLMYYQADYSTVEAADEQIAKIKTNKESLAAAPLKTKETIDSQLKEVDATIATLTNAIEKSKSTNPITTQGLNIVNNLTGIETSENKATRDSKFNVSQLINAEGLLTTAAEKRMNQYAKERDTIATLNGVNSIQLTNLNNEIAAKEQALFLQDKEEAILKNRLALATPTQKVAIQYEQSVKAINDKWKAADPAKAKELIKLLTEGLASEKINAAKNALRDFGKTVAEWAINLKATQLGSTKSQLDVAAEKFDYKMFAIKATSKEAIEGYKTKSTDPAVKEAMDKFVKLTNLNNQNKTFEEIKTNLLSGITGDADQLITAIKNFYGSSKEGNDLIQKVIDQTTALPESLSPQLQMVSLLEDIKAGMYSADKSLSIMARNSLNGINSAIQYAKDSAAPEAVKNAAIDTYAKMAVQVIATDTSNLEDSIKRAVYGNINTNVIEVKAVLRSKADPMVATDFLTKLGFRMDQGQAIITARLASPNDAVVKETTSAAITAWNDELSAINSVIKPTLKDITSRDVDKAFEALTTAVLQMEEPIEISTTASESVKDVLTNLNTMLDVANGLSNEHYTLDFGNTASTVTTIAGEIAKVNAELAKLNATYKINLDSSQVETAKESTKNLTDSVKGLDAVTPKITVTTDGAIPTVNFELTKTKTSLDTLATTPSPLVTVKTDTKSLAELTTVTAGINTNLTALGKNTPTVTLKVDTPTILDVNSKLTAVGVLKDSVGTATTVSLTAGPSIQTVTDKLAGTNTVLTALGKNQPTLQVLTGPTLKATDTAVTNLGFSITALGKNQPTVEVLSGPTLKATDTAVTNLGFSITALGKNQPTLQVLTGPTLKAANDSIYNITAGLTTVGTTIPTVSVLSGSSLTVATTNVKNLTDGLTAVGTTIPTTNVLVGPTFPVATTNVKNLTDGLTTISNTVPTLKVNLDEKSFTTANGNLTAIKTLVSDTKTSEITVRASTDVKNFATVKKEVTDFNSTLKLPKLDLQVSTESLKPLKDEMSALSGMVTTVATTPVEIKFGGVESVNNVTTSIKSLAGSFDTLTKSTTDAANSMDNVGPKLVAVEPMPEWKLAGAKSKKVYDDYMKQLATAQKLKDEHEAKGDYDTWSKKSYNKKKTLEYVESHRPFATGGAFTNGIVTMPTAFDMGVMGEKGPEAIMPLTNVNGKLGVQSSGPSKEELAEAKRQNELLVKQLQAMMAQNAILQEGFTQLLKVASAQNDNLEDLNSNVRKQVNN